MSDSDSLSSSVAAPILTSSPVPSERLEALDVDALSITGSGHIRSNNNSCHSNYLPSLSASVFPILAAKSPELHQSHSRTMSEHEAIQRSLSSSSNPAQTALTISSFMSGATTDNDSLLTTSSSSIRSMNINSPRRSYLSPAAKKKSNRRSLSSLAPLPTLARLNELRSEEDRYCNTSQRH